MANPGKESEDDEGGEIRKNLPTKIKNWGLIRNYHILRWRGYWPHLTCEETKASRPRGLFQGPKSVVELGPEVWLLASCLHPSLRGEDQ